MTILDLLAQQVPAAAEAAAETVPWWKAPTTQILGVRWQEPPYLAIPLFLGILAAVSFLVERVSVFLIGRLTSRTTTRVDDVFVSGLPGLVRTVCALLALNVVARALLAAESQEIASKAVTALSLIVVGVVVIGLGSRMIDAWAETRTEIRPIAPGIKLSLKVAAIPLLLLTVLRVFGVPIEAFLTALGLGSLAVALALQDVLKNIFSGIQLVMDQPIRAGDFVTLGNGTRGTVLEIGMRSTRLRTVDNNTVVIPNATLANETITNADLIDAAYAHAIVIGVDYGSDTRRVEAVLRDEAVRAVAEVPGFSGEPPTVVFVGMGASSLDFRVVVRLRQFAGHPDVVSELNHRLLGRLRAEGIDIPFPTRTVILRNQPAA